MKAAYLTLWNILSIQMGSREVGYAAVVVWRVSIVLTHFILPLFESVVTNMTSSCPQLDCNEGKYKLFQAPFNATGMIIWSRKYSLGVSLLHFQSLPTDMLPVWHWTKYFSHQHFSPLGKPPFCQIELANEWTCQSCIKGYAQRVAELHMWTPSYIVT